MICSTCVKCTSCSWSRGSGNVSSRRLDYHYSYDGRILRLPFYDSATGEQVGLLVFSHQVTHIDATYQNREEKRQAFKRLFVKTDQEQAALPQGVKRADAIVDAYYAAQHDTTLL
jgi:hypothetical protein